MQTISIHDDTRAWKTQVWTAFLAAASLCAIGLAWLPGRAIDRAFMLMSYLFCVSAAFALARFGRAEETRRDPSPLRRTVVRGAFFLAMALTAWGLVQMEIDPAYGAFLGASWLILITACFTVARTMDDGHENAVAGEEPWTTSVWPSCERG